MSFSFPESIRDAIADILETVARDGLPMPRDLDVALDAIESVFISYIDDDDDDRSTKSHLGIPMTAQEYRAHTQKKLTVLDKMIDDYRNGLDSSVKKCDED